LTIGKLAEHNHTPDKRPSLTLTTVQPDTPDTRSTVGWQQPGHVLALTRKIEAMS